MITYKQTDNIFHIKFDGEIVFDDVVKLSGSISEEEVLSDTLLLKYDLRSSKLNLTIKEYTKISEMALNTTAKYRIVKAAFIVISPRQTAMLTIFSHLSRTSHTQRKVFSTSDAAILWLKQFIKS